MYVIISQNLALPEPGLEFELGQQCIRALGGTDVDMFPSGSGQDHASTQRSALGLPRDTSIRRSRYAPPKHPLKSQHDAALSVQHITLSHQWSATVFPKDSPPASWDNGQVSIALISTILANPPSAGSSDHQDNWSIKSGFQSLRVFIP